ncbi:MAG: hypothetical protein ACRDKI_07295 [Solirubrobacterales bacterium]
MSQAAADPTGFAALLPEDAMIADHRRPGTAEAIEQAPNLRLAAAEIVREGYLLHYGESRYYDFADDDLALLAGDRMYAAGLAALAAAADSEAVAALAALIAGCAEAHAVAEKNALQAQTDDLWAATLAMLAPGSGADGSAPRA